MKIRTILLTLVIAGIFCQLFAQQKTDKTQETTQSPLRNLELQQQKFDVSQFDILKQLEPQVTSSTIFNDQLFEGPVDPNKYLVGPNDIFSLGIWGVLNQPLPLIVSPEGSL